MTRISLIVVFSILTFTAPGAFAEPYLAVQSGAKCSGCHTNPSGGGRRNVFGSAFGQTVVSARPPKSVWTQSPESRIKFGGDLRANLDSTTIPNQADVFAFELEEALFYVEVELLKEQVLLYIDQRVSPGAALNRKAYGLFWLSGRNFYAKAGRFFLPFGFRLEDDTAFVKQVTGINYDNPDTGVEFGLDLDSITATVAITNGTAGAAETDTGKQLSLRTSYVQNAWRVGASANFNDTDDNDRIIGGLFGGLRTGPVSWLAEFALIQDDADGATRDQLATFTEANYAWRKGHNIKLSYEHLDPDQDIDENEQNRYSAQYEYFPIQFVQVTGGLRVNEGIPQVSSQNTDEAFVQLHLYF